jgi:perosamine synthetase
MLRVRHPPHRLDLTFADWLPVAASLWRRDERAARAALEEAWAPAGDGLAFLSVRSAFDCALSALDWPPGSEILVSEVNIREMVDLVRLHGLVAVPLPVDPRTMQPPPEAIDRALGPRTRGVLLAHLFGARADVGPLFARARAAGLVCFEDAAQAFAGPAERGHPLADLTFFSFGTIKTATALGGALARVADPRLAVRMAGFQSTWPLQPRRRYSARIGLALLFLAVQTPLIYTLFSALCRLRGADGCAVIRRLTRSFRGLDAEAWLRAVRHRPSAPLLRAMRRRLTTFPGRTARRLEARRRWGAEVAAATSVPGSQHACHSHWLIPVRVADVERAQSALRAIGIDGSSPSNLVCLGPAPSLMEGLVFVPAYPELPAAARRSLLGALEAHAC